MITVIDYDMGNVGSILNMLSELGIEGQLSNDPKVILNSESIILPGVGSFDLGMSNLRKKGLDKVITHFVNDLNRPMLGICLGMQMLGTGSEEGLLEGLSLIPFRCLKFKFDEHSKLKIPHMGWDIVTTDKQDDPLLIDVKENSRYYFVHSYYAACQNKDNELLSCDYGHSFTAAVKRGKVYGVQFHPEKSHIFGMKILENFARIR